MYDLSEGGYGDEMEVQLVLSECLPGLHASVGFYTRKGFEGLLTENREIDYRRMGWRYG
jgi:hypothetical protein